MPCDQQGGIDMAAARSGADGWIDLSTAMTRRPWPQAGLPDGGTADPRVPAAAWFGCSPAQVLPLADAAGAMRSILPLLPAGRAAVLAGDSGHAADLRRAGWQVTTVDTLAAMEGADLAVAVNPNNPDGREWPPALLERLAGAVGLLVVDERHADPRPDLSLAPFLPANALVLRSLAPLWGLASPGFVLADAAWLDRLAPLVVPAARGALRAAARALADRAWIDAAILYHAEAALRLDRLAVGAGWRLAGGTHLFRLYDTGDAAAAQDRLARAHVLSRRFGWSRRKLRLGIPGNPAEWDRLTAVLRKN